MNLKKFLVPPAMRVGHEYTRTNPIKNAKEIGKGAVGFMKKNYNLKEPIFMKDPQGRNMNNLWTGYGYGGKGRALATASLIGGGTIIASNPKAYQNFVNGDFVEEQSEALDVESLPSTRSDGLGYQAQVGNNSDLSASGDLVFAMHKTRHTGQF
ncbi:hypothetical protein B14_200005 (plasmid) [Bacillus licheniformis]|uniref:hypothetical protein n=1 Tax=Bacillus TaxID=1386 RepID=UPI0009B7D6ED|nr:MULTISPECIES: hypothetical protein [Bacillus]ARC67218.1 hypothetical protein B14_200005 [Bacillus licheniformis]ARW46143.1 hypothetical protein S100141_04925 [Bacillus licheniformis]MCY8577158.1 hypothetical protein [Bacillus haynesii]MDE1421878.1 hypothetical protein [Bacillus licheniformis]MEC0475883.1 hypothetical protein [Bacillus licheniformis]